MDKDYLCITMVYFEFVSLALVYGQTINNTYGTYVRSIGGYRRLEKKLGHLCMVTCLN